MSLVESPILKILAAGKPLSQGLGNQVLEFTYEDSEKEDDLMTLVFADPYRKLADSEQVQEGLEWSIQWGFPRLLYPARRVLLKKPRYSDGELEIKALDLGASLKTEEGFKTFRNKTIYQIATEIAQKHKLKPVLDSNLNNKLEFMMQAGKTDWQFLEYLVSLTPDHYMKVTRDELRILKRNLAKSPVGQFLYTPGPGSRLLSYDIEVKDQDEAKTSRQTTVVSVNPETGKSEVFSANEQNTPTENLGSVRANTRVSNAALDYVSNSFGWKPPQSTGKVVVVPHAPKKQNSNIAQSIRRESLLNNIEANFEIAASDVDPILESGDLIEVYNIGKKFSGSYRIETISHKIVDGWVYEIKAKRNALGAVGPKAFPKLNGAINTKSANNKKVAQVKKVITSVLTGGSI